MLRYVTWSHITWLLLQVRVPETGGRILVASDGVWDAFEKMVRVCRMVRRWPVEVSQCPCISLVCTVPIKFRYLVKSAYTGISYVTASIFSRPGKSRREEIYLLVYLSMKGERRSVHHLRSMNGLVILVGGRNRGC